MFVDYFSIVLQKKVAKLNKKYKTLIEGEQVERPQGQRPPMGERPSSRPSGRLSGGMGGPGGGGSYTSNGLGSPVIYSTADVTVSNATLTSNMSEGVCIEGDADSGNSHFTMNGGLLTNKQGHLFHVTNTNAIISLNNVKLVNEDPAKVLLSVCADGWQGASNKATLNANRQQLEGTILVGSDSELTMNLADGSTFNGCINGNS